MTEEQLLPDEKDTEPIIVWKGDLNELLESCHAIKMADGTEYFHIPFWFEKAEDGYILHSFEKLPEELREYITKARMGGEHNPKMPQPWMDEVLKHDSNAFEGSKD